MINSNSLLAPDRAERLRRALVVLAAMAGLAAAGIVLSSQTVTDFLREGPVRVVDLEGERLRLLLGLGTALATMAALACFWVRPGLPIARCVTLEPLISGWSPRALPGSLRRARR